MAKALRTIERIGEEAVRVNRMEADLAVAKRRLSNLMARARREGHSLRDIGVAAGVSNVTVMNRTKEIV